MCEVRGVQHIPEKKIFPWVMSGLHTSVKIRLPRPNPTSLAQLFCIYDALVRGIPPEDDFWALKRLMDFTPPTIAVSPAREADPAFPINHNECFKCGETGHFAKHCSNPRNKSIQPKKKNRRRRKTLKRVSGDLGRGPVRVNLTL
ncbi:unnamed protein product [Orchesella dallaii]|uniref:CCHC-type domain-containing protein n=1 Tax=Orchesella dallaii TaxID=48710 RepID=A0ABP1RU07_9HEXA